jgi:hypothetical protein
MSGRAFADASPRRLAAAAACAAGLLVASGCSGTYTAGRRDDAIARAVARTEVPEGFRYYVYPGAGLAEAVLGIRTGYTLAGDRWREVTLTPEALRRYADELGVGRGGAESLAPAQALVAPDGDVAGIWYGRTPPPPARLDPERRIEVPVPVRADLGEDAPPWAFGLFR